MIDHALDRESNVKGQSFSYSSHSFIGPRSRRCLLYIEAAFSLLKMKTFAVLSSSFFANIPLLLCARDFQNGKAF